MSCCNKKGNCKDAAKEAPATKAPVTKEADKKDTKKSK